MMAEANPIAPQDLLRETNSAQSAASNPTTSVWVDANAGAGKTHVLKMRVLRLLLAGVAPERILCLTYTKAAAAEMAQRIFQELASWAISDQQQLASILASLLDRVPLEADLIAARQLFARAIETPGGLKVQTIHAFCERLLQRFPLEAGVSPGFSILDDGMARALMREAIDRTLAEANALPGDPLGQSVKRAVRYASEVTFDEILSQALKERAWLVACAENLSASSTANADKTLHAQYLEAFGLPPASNRDAIETEMAALMRNDQLDDAARRLEASGKSRDAALAGTIRTARAASEPRARAEALAEVFLTKDRSQRSEKGGHFISAGIRASDPAWTDTMTRAQDAYHRLYQKRQNLLIAEATSALAVIAERVMRHYTKAKSERATLDYDDLIERSANLLGGHQAAQWVLFKLDGGLDHILVDEAQDTSPLQWQVVEQLASEFFAGTSAHDDRDGRDRTMFAVGDEKQSIYSFQGAAPEMFAATGQRFAQRAVASEKAFTRIPLTLSFRTVAPLLAAVDSVFSEAERTPGLSATGATIRHMALRQGEAGLLEVWPTEKGDETQPAPAFSPLEETAGTSPVTRLAEHIADTIDAWLKSGEQLSAEGRSIRPRDILILVRKRAPFAPVMVRALLQRGIPVAGADRVVLGDHIAVQDLMALADFLLLPEDDLSLAVVLKSPFFSLDDDALLAIAPERKGQLWTALLARAKTDPMYVPAAEQLKKWRTQADFSPPFEFFANLLDRDGMRARMLARLGPDAGDAIDEFINLTLTYDEQFPPSMQGFVSWLRQERREIKRDMEQGRDEVRVMTVHGSKGLEAPIVFLPDTCSAPKAERQSPIARIAQQDDALPKKTSNGAISVAWAIKGSGQSAPIRASREDTQQRQQAEHNRLLYVAMTRARDRLYVAGFENAKGIAKGSWYETIREGINDIATRDGDILRIESAQSKAANSTPPDAAPQTGVQHPPEWAGRPAPPAPLLSVPLAPSRLELPEPDEDGEGASLEWLRTQAAPPMEPAARSPIYLARDGRLLRGTLTHALLEHLPKLAKHSWATTATSFIAERAGELPPPIRDAIVVEVMKILTDPSFEQAFGPNSRAEVSIVADVPPPDGQGPSLKVNGQIDRLVDRENDILIVDYKSNREPPRTPETIPEAYLLQLTAYRLAVQQIFVHKKVSAALLWTDTPELMAVPERLLDAAVERLWKAAT